MRNRFLWFLLSILLGSAAGLAYGWVIHPLRTDQTPARRLSSDYQTDYILMVAEVYHQEGDSALAAHRLSLLGDKPALRMVQEAILTAGELGYSRQDLDTMFALAKGLSAPPGNLPTGVAP